jgi:hypothetical protein
MYVDNSVPSGFKWPENGFLKLSGILSFSELLSSPHRDHNGNPCHYVIMNGQTSGTRRGRLTSVLSRIRFANPNCRTSREVGVIPCDNDLGPFSCGGDSGALIVGTTGKAAALLTGGKPGQTGSGDITYGTPFFWAFENVTQGPYPGANLYDF